MFFSKNAMTADKIGFQVADFASRIKRSRITHAFCTNAGCLIRNLEK